MTLEGLLTPGIYERDTCRSLRGIYAALLGLAGLAAGPALADAGEEVAKTRCSLCHETGVSGAPKIGNRTDWEPRAARGKLALYEVALKGKPNTAMMARGGFNDLSRDEVMSAVDYMLKRAGFDPNALPVIAPARPAEPAAQAFASMKIEAVVTTKEQIRLDFADGSDHFVLMVKREGKATGRGPLMGTAVTEYGRHDIVPGVGGDPSGYLVFAAGDGDVAYVKWSMRAVFVPGADGKPVRLDNGFWEVVGATGKFNGMQGAGTLQLKAVSPTDRNFILEGELVPVRR